MPRVFSPRVPVPCALLVRAPGESDSTALLDLQPFFLPTPPHPSPLPGGEGAGARMVTLAACPSKCSALASVTIAFASRASPCCVYRSTLARLRNSYTLIPLVKRAVVFVGRQ